MAARFVHANGLRFTVQVSGPAQAPLALLLHGFPDTPATWRHLAPALVADGYRVAAPYLRGYAPTEVPGDRAVEPRRLAADVSALHEALDGDDRAVVIGHDWGAIAAARTVAARPERWRALVTLAVPTEASLVAALTDPRQLARARYAFAFQQPGAERRLADPDLTLVRELWRRWSPGYEPTVEDLEPLRACLTSPGVPRAVLSYYRGIARATLAGRALHRRVLPPSRPHLHVHGRDDGCIAVASAERAARLARHPGSRTEVVDGAGHWVHLEAPDVVATTVLGFLAASRDGEAVGDGR